MTVKQLYDELGKFLIDHPNTANDEIYYLQDGLEVNYVGKIDIEWDISWEGRYICLSE